MEVSGLVIGLSGLISVYDKACELWRVIGAAKGFGDDVGDSLRKLEIEFFRFQSWWTVIRKLEVLPARPVGGTTCLEMPLFAAMVPPPAQNPVITIAQSILRILQEIEGVLRDSGALSALESRGATTRPEEGVRSGPRSIGNQLGDARSGAEGLSRHLLSAVSWRKRVKHDATPWRQSNKELLDDKLQQLGRWNDVLFSILPRELSESILTQGMSGLILAQPEEAGSIAGLDRGAISQQAKLLQVHRKLAENESKSSSISDYSRTRLLHIDRSDIQGDGESFSIVCPSVGEPARLIEWYQITEATGTGIELRSIVRERLARLSILLSAENKPSTLCAAESIGYVEGDQYYRFGLVSRIPDGLSPHKPPVTLHSLLNRMPLPGTSSKAPLPSLSQRFTLASSFATSLYTFMLARWHHKMFNSLKIYFLFSEGDGSLPNLDVPLVGGYSVSRPSAVEEISICAPSSSLPECYLHPQLQVPARERPRYTTSYEIYSLGLLLAEIGFWQPVSKIAAATAPRHGGHSAKGLKNAVINKVSTDLACWMGEQYRDITLRCLKAGDELRLGERVSGELSEFYWSIVMELVLFEERVKVLRSP